MKQKLIRLVSYSTLTSLFGGLLVAGVAFAQGTTPAPTIVTDVNNLGDVFCPVVDWMFWVLLAVSVIMVIWAAYTYLIAEDDTEKVHRATKTLTYAAVAIVVALIAKGFPDLVQTIFSSSATVSPFACTS